MEKLIIQGEWDGEVIWRYPTVAERYGMMEKMSDHDCHAGEEDGCGGCELIGNVDA